MQSECHCRQCVHGIDVCIPYTGITLNTLGPNQGWLKISTSFDLNIAAFFIGGILGIGLFTPLYLLDKLTSF